MKPVFPAIALGAALAACVPSPRPYAPVENVRYSALGQDPFWLLTIGDDRIVLRLAAPGGAPGEAPGDIVFPRTLPVHDGEVTRWQSGEGTGVITIEARHGATPCALDGRSFEDSVRVTLSGRMLEGCGGRLAGEPRR